jgi:hypothetical protein
LLAGVSCAGTECFAVGSWYDQPPAADALAEGWNGTSWRLESSPDGPTESTLAGVSCVAAGHRPSGAIDCLAVGSPVLTGAMAAGGWRLVAKTSDLDAASRATPGNCMAVGAKPSGAAPLFATWNGKKWRLTELPQPPVDHFSAQLTGIACASTSSCVTVGWSGNADSYAEVYANGRWRLSTTRNPG